MNRIEIEHDHLVERYLAGRLSETETRRFETYWIENPDLLRDLEQGARLKSGLARLHDTDQLDSLLRTSWWPGRFRLLVLAASVAVVGIAVVLWSGAGGSAGAILAAVPSALPGLEGAALPRGSVYSLMRLRSAATVDAVIALPTTPQALALRILPEVELDAPMTSRSAGGSPQYAVSLIREDPAGNAAVFAQADSVAVDADGFVTVFIDSRSLSPARYRLGLEPVGARPGAGGTGFVIDVRGGTVAP